MFLNVKDFSEIEGVTGISGGSKQDEVRSTTPKNKISVKRVIGFLLTLSIKLINK